MVIYVKGDEDNDIFNFDNIIHMFPCDDSVKYTSNGGHTSTLVACDSTEQAERIVFDIYQAVIKGARGMVLDITKYRDVRGDKR